MAALLDKKKLLEFMGARFDKLQEQSVRDFTGDFQPRIHELREVKYWKEAIGRKLSKGVNLTQIVVTKNWYPSPKRLMKRLPKVSDTHGFEQK